MVRFLKRDLKDYPVQPIPPGTFAEARNYFIRQLHDDEYVLFTSDHEEVPRMLEDYISKLQPRFAWYKIRLIRLVNGRLERLFDPTYQPNLCSNRMRFIGWPEHPNCKGGIIDIPMLHNKTSHGHSYHSTVLPESYRKRYVHLAYRLFRVYRDIAYDELGRGMFRKGDDRLY